MMNMMHLNDDWYDFFGWNFDDIWGYSKQFLLEVSTERPEHLGYFIESLKLTNMNQAVEKNT